MTEPRLSAPDHPALQLLMEHLLVLRFATTKQLARLTGDRYGSARSALRQTTRHLNFLERRGDVLRLERRVGGWLGGSGPAVWALTTSGYRRVAGKRGSRQRPHLLSTTFLEHLLAVAEARVVITETVRTMPDAAMVVQAEPHCWRTYVGLHGERLSLRPDLMLELTTTAYQDRYFIEVDRATENPARVIAKSRQYQQYRRSGIEQQHAGVFPAVLWIVPSEKRRAQLERHIAAAELPRGMFHALTLADLSGVLREGPPSS